MTRSALALVIVAGCGLKSTPALQVPQGGMVPDQRFSVDGFELSIRRSFGKEHEANLIRRAEAHMPSRQDVLAACGDPTKQEIAGIPAQGSVWWYVTFDGVRIPFAITGDAISYYAELIETFHHGDFGPSRGIEMERASLDYQATVTREDAYEREGQTFTDVHVVRMRLTWSQYCGPECGMDFGKQRTVVFDSSGEVLFVSGDGTTDYLVS